VVEGWIADVRAGRVQAVVRDLLARHYDPGYIASTRRNFTRFAAAHSIALSDRSPAALARAATQIRAQEQ